MEIETESNLLFRLNFPDLEHIELFEESLIWAISMFLSQKSKPILTQFDKSNNQCIENEFKNLRFDLFSENMRSHV